VLNPLSRECDCPTIGGVIGMDFYSENNPFCASCNDALPDYYLKGSDLRTIVIGF
jgi:hypothetical protein